MKLIENSDGPLFPTASGFARHYGDIVRPGDLQAGVIDDYANFFGGLDPAQITTHGVHAFCTLIVLDRESLPGGLTDLLEVMTILARMHARGLQEGWIGGEANAFAECADQIREAIRKLPNSTDASIWSSNEPVDENDIPF